MDHLVSWAWCVVRLVWRVKKGGKKNSRGKGYVSFGKSVPADDDDDDDGLEAGGLGVLEESEGAGGVVDILAGDIRGGPGLA